MVSDAELAAADHGQEDRAQLLEGFIDDIDAGV